MLLFTLISSELHSKFHEPWSQVRGVKPRPSARPLWALGGGFLLCGPGLKLGSDPSGGVGAGLPWTRKISP